LNLSGFTESVDAIPDLRPYYEATDGGTGSPIFMTVIVSLDLNGDNKLDLLMHMFRFQKQLGVVDTQPASNRLVALLNKGDGTFSDGTETLFGTKDVILNGASRKARVGDINGDGYPDILYAMNQEDGRLSSSPSLWFAQPNIIVSNGAGKYKVQSFSEPSYNHSVGFARDNTGSIEILLDHATGNSFSYKYVDGNFVPGSVYPETTMGTFLAAPSLAKPGQTDAMMTNPCPNDRPCGLAFFRKTIDGVWSKAGEFKFANAKPIQQLNWNNEIMPNWLYTYKGVDYFGGGFFESNICNFKPGADPIAIAKLNTRPASAPVNGVYVEGGPFANLLLGFSLYGNSGQEVDLNLDRPETDVNSNFFECRDVNGDGYEDIVDYPYRNGGQPIVYANNKAGGFAKVDQVLFPMADSEWGGGATSMLLDVDGDGKMDMISWPSNGVKTSSKRLRPMLFKGVR